VKLLIVIVIYKKLIKELSILKSVNIIDENIDIFFYDNSPKEQELLPLKEINFLYEHNTKNPGVSYAYNRGIQKAKELSKDAILILDQDTNFNMSYLDVYKKAYIKYRDTFLYAPIVGNNSKTKIYSPAHLNNYVGKVVLYDDFIFKEQFSLTGMSVINSGLMIPLKIFEETGLYNEKIKLDFSDIYFIEKYKKYKSEIILVDVHLKHSLSGDEGKNYEAELYRFMYYCNGAKEMSTALKVSTYWVVFRRMLRLIQKYYTLKPVKIFFDYYIGNKII